MVAGSEAQIRNFGLFGHGGSGKTSLAEALLYVSGTVSRLGKVEEGNTTLDFDPDEVERKVSINAAMATLDWKSTRFYLVDTPGYADFTGEALGAIRVVDVAVLVVPAVEGVEVQTEMMWERARELGIPVVVFVNKMDRERASFQRTLDDITSTLGGEVIPVNLPIGEETEFKGLVDLISNRAFQISGDKGELKEVDIPEEMAGSVDSRRLKLIEAAATADDSLLEKYLEEDVLTDEEVLRGLKKGLVTGSLTPVLCGSAFNCGGVTSLLDFGMDVFPAPEDLPDVVGQRPGDGEEVSLARDKDSHLSALVFRTQADPYVGKLTYFRVFSGSIDSDSSVYNSSRGSGERVGQLYVVKGKDQEKVGKIAAGEMGAVAKLAATFTGDTFCDKEEPIVLPPIEFPAPVMSLAVEPKTKGDEDKLSTALAKIAEEDPTLDVRRDTEVNQTLISGAGEGHLDIVVDKLKRKFGVDVTTQSPRVPYKETVRGSAESEGKYKKQTGGHGQYGHCYLKIEPRGRGEGFEFVDKIVGGAIPRQFIPGVEKGVVEAMNGGFLAGYPMVDMRVTLYDGSFHSVDSSELAFKMAASLALKKGVEDANPVILEPIMNVKVTVPEAYMGDVIGDLNSKRGRIQGMEPRGKLQVVSAKVPLAEMFRYAIDLRSITGGRGYFTMELSHYEEVPPQVEQKIITSHQEEKESS